MCICAPETGCFPVKPHSHRLSPWVSVEQAGADKSSFDQVVLKISEFIDKTLYFWMMRLGNKYEIIQALTFLKTLQNTGAFHGIQSSQCLTGDRQSRIRVQVYYQQLWDMLDYLCICYSTTKQNCS